MADLLLEISDLCAGYGDAAILEQLTFSLKSGQSLALLGRNGMGKSTLIATIMGATRRFSGNIHFAGKNISHWPSYQRARSGIGWVSQERDIFTSLSVERNLTLTARIGPWNLQSIYRLFPRLQERRRHLGGHLSGGEQQMLAIARALMLNPKLILLDEPTEGLAPVIVTELMTALHTMKKTGGLSILIAEQHARLALTLSDTALLLERGRIVHQNSSQHLIDDSQMLERFLGVQSVT